MSYSICGIGGSIYIVYILYFMTLQVVIMTISQTKAPILLFFFFNLNSILI